LNKKILIVAPHMDDEVLGCGGVIAKHIKNKDQVVVCIFCNRAYDGVYNQELIDKEKESAKKVKEFYGYQDLIFFDFPDEDLSSNFRPALRSLEKLAKEYLPQIVYLPFRGDLHQDHKTTSHIGNIVFRSSSGLSTEKVYSYEVPSGTDMSFPDENDIFNPNVFVDISNEINKKVDAMKLYEAESREFPHPRSSEMLLAKARSRGSQSNFEAAEAFMLLFEAVV